MMMKIVIDARFLGTPTGIGRYVEELVNGLGKSLSLPLKKGEDIEFVVLVSKVGWKKWKPKISLEPEAPPQAQHVPRAQIRKKLVDARWYTVAEQFALWRVLREENPDLVHFPHWNICYFWNGPFVVTIHDLILLDYPTRRASKLGSIAYWIKYKILFPLVLRKAIYKAKKIIVTSNYTKQSILKHFPKVDGSKIEAIYEGASKLIVNSQSLLFQHKVNTPYLLYVGNALPHKNLEFLVRVFKKLKTVYPHLNPLTSKGGRKEREFNLVLVGEPSYFYDRLKEYVKNLGMHEDVIFTGRVSDEELAELYKNAALYVFPSLLEGFGLPPLEAMAHGAPVVAANSSCLPEILGDAAVYFNPKDEDDAVRKIGNVLENDSLRDSLLKKGCEQNRKYSWEKQAKETFDIYRKLCITR